MISLGPSNIKRIIEEIGKVLVETIVKNGFLKYMYMYKIKKRNLLIIF